MGVAVVSVIFVLRFGGPGFRRFVGPNGYALGSIPVNEDFFDGSEARIAAEHGKARRANRGAEPFRGNVSADLDQIDDEDEGLSAEEVPARRPVGEVRRDHELATSAFLHTRDAVLPTLDQATERELDAFAPAPRRVELFTRVVLDTRVVHGHGIAGFRLGTLSDDDVADDQGLGRGALGGVERGLCAVCSHDSIQPDR
ncbi:hypothetical protein MIC448_1190013 [Microbacterium sp. C448]|nr:hypothetical protein MIC448_1190013 [Microbacterium sp. C448]